MDWLTALLGAGGSILSGFIGSNTATSAAAQQARAIQAAINYQQGNINTAVAASQGALDQALAQQTAPTERALKRINDAITNSIQRANAASKANVADTNAKAKEGNKIQQGFYDKARADSMPWMEAGKTALNSYMGELGLADGPNGTPFESAFQTTPGYEFQVEEGEKGVVNNLSALGMKNSGAALKALTSFRQGLADQTYTEYLDRLKGVSDTGLGASQNLGSLGVTTGANMATTLMNAASINAKSRTDAAQNANNAAMGGATTIGEILSNQATNNTNAIMNNATNLGNILVRGGEGVAGNIANLGTVNASGTVGSGNAWLNALGNFTNSAGTALGSLQPPAYNPNPTGL